MRTIESGGEPGRKSKKSLGPTCNSFSRKAADIVCFLLLEILGARTRGFELARQVL
jgi:hypothetical protein